MRSILLAAVLAASTLVTHVRTADACGGGYSEWTPAALFVAKPTVKPKRAFALMWERMDATRAATAELAPLSTSSFDTSSSAPHRTLAAARTVTLLGPSGTKLFETKSTVWLDLAFDREGPREAMELPKGDFVIALIGHHKEARWSDFVVIHGSTITSYTADNVHFTVGHGAQTFHVNGLTLEGRPLGIVHVRGARYVAAAVGESRTEVQLVRI